MALSRRLAHRAVGTALTLLAPVAAVSLGTGSAHAESSQFAACPGLTDLPQGADPAEWRCEVMSATGHLGLGRIDAPITTPMTVTHAEGPLDGRTEEVWGGMTAAPIRQDHTPLTITPRYAGHFDFLSDAERVGELDLRFQLSGPGLPARCSIGTASDAVHLVLQPATPTSTTSLEDATFSAPRTSGCGPLGPVLDLALGLPSAGGHNSIRLDGRRAMRYYDAPSGAGEATASGSTAAASRARKP